ncbi:hypothetical protein [Haloarchaeobius baliensis]|uniref:hypothetical protein n=1 Tax=Haloarchaeobius baliensis TaxID=1670458 RepID=UPI003F882202
MAQSEQTDSDTDSPEEQDAESFDGDSSDQSSDEESSEDSESDSSDEQESESSGTDITPQEVLTIIRIDDREQFNAVQQWVESPSSQDNPELRQRAQEWVSNIEEQQQERRNQMEGYKQISSSVEVVGYEFNSEEETVTLLIQSSERKTVTLQDVSATIASDSGFSYRTEQVKAGVTEIQMEAQEEKVNGSQTQMIAVVDPEAQRGDTIERRDESSFFSTLKWWYIPLAGFGGGALILIQTVRFVRNKEQEGENEFIPLE